MVALERYDRDNPTFDGLSARNAEARTRKVVDMCHGDVLDIGCGYGYLADFLKDKEDVKEYYGFDYGEEVITMNKGRFTSNKINFKCVNIKEEKLFNIVPIAPNVIICNEFIEHIEKEYQEEMLKQIKQQFDLQGFGKLIGTTPKQPKEGPNPAGNHYHVWEHTYNSMKEMLEQIFDKGYEIKMDVWFGNATYFEVTKNGTDD